MAQPDPEFDHPPIVELVLGVQFLPLVGLTNAHFGWFWKRYLSEEWVRAANAPLLPDQFERFSESQVWLTPGFLLKIEEGPATGRAQFLTANSERMIQLQPSRFHYNWQKRDQVHPRYSSVKAAFVEHFNRFQELARDAKLAPVVPNQWELTYVDRVPRGELWNTPADWPAILPGLFPATAGIEGLSPESFGGEWHFEIHPRRGRLHAAVQFGQVGDYPEPALALSLTARGPVGTGSGLDWSSGLDLGHEAIIRAFLGLTSDSAHRAWGKKK